MTIPVPTDHVLLDDDALSPLVLSPRRLQGWLSDRLGVECRVTPRRIRYKPGTSTALAFDLTIADEPARPCLALGYSRAARPKLDKTVRHAGPALIALDVTAGVAVTGLIGDRALRGLRDLLTRPPHGATVTTLRHNPHRRWVGRLVEPTGRTTLVRAYGSSTRWERAHHAHLEFASTGLPVPHLLERHRRRQTLQLTWTPGRSLETAVAGHDLEAGVATDGAVAAGALLARLHESRVRLSAVDAWAEHHALTSAADQVIALLPGTADAVRSSLARLLETWPTPTERTPVHGDFSADQLIVGGADDPVALIDLDQAALGSPAADLGSFAAVSPGLAAALTTGYAEARALPDAGEIRWHEAAQRLRRAAEPFRGCAPDWRVRVADQVAEVQATVAAL